jgi:hypothetical protein
MSAEGNRSDWYPATLEAHIALLNDLADGKEVTPDEGSNLRMLKTQFLVAQRNQQNARGRALLEQLEGDVQKAAQVNSNDNTSKVGWKSPGGARRYDHFPTEDRTGVGRVEVLFRDVPSGTYAKTSSGWRFQASSAPAENTENNRLLHISIDNDS